MSDYEYRGLLAQTWDIFRGDTSGWSDRFFYLELIAKSGQPVLDVGCGTGRLLLDYLDQGIDIEGVDVSPEMLALCRSKAAVMGLSPALYEQPMEMLDLQRRYRTILIPSSSLQLVIEPDLARRSLSRLLAHLQPGGALAASFMTLWRQGDPLEREWEKSTPHPETGATLRRMARSRYDPASQCEDTEDLYQVIVGDQVVAEEQHRRSPATRSYTQAQARLLFESAGLVDVHVYHEFTWEPAAPEDEIFVLVGYCPETA